MARAAGERSFTSLAPEINFFPKPEVVKENYIVIGESTFRYPQKNDFEPSTYYEPMRKFVSGNYALSDVDAMNEVVKTHEKYAFVCDLRDSAWLDVNVPKAFDTMFHIFAPALKAPILSVPQTVDLLDTKKGSGFGCSGTKGAAWAHDPLLCSYCVDHPSDWNDTLPVWVCSGKLEVRLTSKDCRCYLICPLWLQMQLQRFCKGQNNQFLESRFKLPSAVGMNLPYEWPKLHAHLHRYSTPGFKTKYFQGDIEKFDSTQYRAFYHLICKLRAHGLHLGGAAKAEFESLYYNIINRVVVLPNGSVVFTKDGNPSGSPNTTTDNGMVHIAMLLMCWFKEFNTFSGFVSFLDRTGYVVFGDDCIAAINCPDDERFFAKLPELWRSLYGSNFVTEIVDDWSKVHFLGVSPLSSQPPFCYLTKPYDIDRQLTNLVEKGRDPVRFDPLVEIQRGLAHRTLLSFTYLDDRHQELPMLKMCIDRIFEDYEEMLSGNPMFSKLLDLHKLSDADFAHRLINDDSISSLLESPSDFCVPNVSPSGFLDSYRPVQMLVSNERNRQQKKVMSTLSYREWCQEHTTKLAGLSKAEKKTRYASYLQSTATRAAVPSQVRTTSAKKSKPSGVLQPIGISGSAPASTTGNSTSRVNQWSATNYASALHNYAMSLGNPWNPTYNGAKVVSTMAEDSSVVNVVQYFTAGCPSTPDPSDANIPYANTGCGAFVANPTALFMNYMYTPGSQQIGFTKPEDNDATESPGLLVYTVPNAAPLVGLNLCGGTTTADPGTLLYPNYSPANPAWVSLKDCQEIQNLSSKFRLVSAGVTLEFMSTALTGSGELAFGCIPSSAFQQRGLIMNDTNFEVLMKTLSWTDFLDLEGVQKCPAIEGCTLVWTPYDESTTEYRESILQYVSSQDTVPGLNRIRPTIQQVKRTALSNSKSALKKDHPHIRTYNPTTDAFLPVVKTADEAHRKRSEYVDLCKRKGRKPHPTAYAVDVDPSSAFEVTIEYLGAGFSVPMPCDGTQDIMSAIATSVAMAGELAAQAGAGTFDLKSQDEIIIEAMEQNPNPNSPYMVCMWNGVAPALAPNVVGAFDCYELSYYCNYELIPDEQTFRIAQSPASPAYVGNPGPAIAAVNTVPLSNPGKPAPAKSTWSKIKSGFMSAVKTGVKVAGYVGKAAKIADEIGDVVAAFA